MSKFNGKSTSQFIYRQKTHCLFSLNKYFNYFPRYPTATKQYLHVVTKISASKLPGKVRHIVNVCIDHMNIIITSNEKEPIFNNFTTIRILFSNFATYLQI